MRAISANRRAVREALAREGWRFAVVGSLEDLKHHRDSWRTLVSLAREALGADQGIAAPDAPAESAGESASATGHSDTEEPPRRRRIFARRGHFLSPHQ
jgi:hypothetical protein